MEKLVELVSSHDVLILYSPLKNEVDLTKLTPISDFKGEIVYLPQNKDLDPFAFALDYRSKFENMNVCVFSPGTKFDVFGTRHGRGGGWYDRFFSSVPHSWTRIGVCDISILSKEKLESKTHDQRMDYIFTKKDNEFLLIKCTLGRL